MATTYIVTGVDTGIPSLPNDSVLTGLKVGDTFTTTLDSGVEAELIAAGLIAKSPLSSPVVMQSDGTLAAKDGRSFSGGSGASGAHVTHKFPFAFDTPGLLTGATPVFTDGYVPAVGDLLLDAWIEIDTAWDGTTPTGDVGPADQNGWFENAQPGRWDLTNADADGAVLPGILCAGSGAQAQGLYAGVVQASRRALPGALTDIPLVVVVSQNGQIGGADPGSTQGSAVLYVTTATL